jgi:sRNA-binding protein
MKKKISKADYDAAIDVLLELRAVFPQAISRLDVMRRRPLKIGIDQAVRELLPEVEAATIGHALRIYTCHVGYLRSLFEGAPRIDLNGAQVGTVDAEAASRAKAQLDNTLRRAAAREVAKVAAAKAARKQKLVAGIAGLKATARARAA